MPRPSRNLDQALLAAGRALFPERGCAGLALREVADAAGVNLGMFHYHFGSRAAFLRALMQQAYEEMFSTLTLQAARDDDPVANLRASLKVLARFARDNRPFLTRVLADALCGEACAKRFLRENLPRHIGVLLRIVDEGQKAKRLSPLPAGQVLGTCLGAVAMPILMGGAVAASGEVPAQLSRLIEQTMLTDAAIDQRIDLVLTAISQPGTDRAAGAKPRNKAPRTKARGAKREARGMRR